MTVSVQLRVTPAQRKALDDAATARRKRTGEKVDRASILRAGAEVLCHHEGIPWPDGDAKEPA